MAKLKLAILATHPVHYQIDWFRAVARRPDVEVTVFFGSDFGLKEEIDPTFQHTVRWYDSSLLEGLHHKFLRNYPLSRSPSSIWNPLNPSIFAELRRGRYDAIWIHGYASVTNYLAYLAALLTGTPVLFRGDAVLRHDWPKWLKLFKSVFLRTFFRGVAAVLPVGTASAEFYRYYGVEPERTFLTPYAVNNEQLMALADMLRPRRAELRRRLGLDGLPSFLMVAKLIDRKRPMDLLEAYRRLEQPAAIVYAGDGPELPRLRDYAATHGLRNVHFLGFLRPELLPEIYAATDVFVLASAYDPWGLVVNEAMCYGLPIVATSGVGATRDLVRNGENGFVYPVGDVEALAGILRSLASDPRSCEAMGVRSRAMISAWSLESSTEGIVNALRSVASRATPAGRSLDVNPPSHTSS